MKPSVLRLVPRRVCACVLLLAEALLCAPGYADDAQRGPYIGAALHRTSFDLEPPSLLTPGFEGDDVALKLVGGYRLMRRLAIEASYLDVTDESRAADGELFAADVAALSVAAVGIWPLRGFDLYGKAGLGYWKTEVRRPALPASRDSFVDPFAGVGVQYRVGRVALRADFELLQLRLLDSLDSSPGGGGWLETWSVGAVWQFH